MLIALAHDRRRTVYFNVPEPPTGEWTAPQPVEAFSWKPSPKDLPRDRDVVYGRQFRKHGRGLGMQERPAASRSLWRTPHAECATGAVRRKRLDRAAIFDERHLKRILHHYFAYCRQGRLHRPLEMESPDGRVVHSPERGEVIEFPAVHGLHHYYLRQAA